MTDKPRPRYIIVIGYPAVGKSEYGNTLREQGITVLSGDDAIEVVRKRHNLESGDQVFFHHRQEMLDLMSEWTNKALSEGKDIATVGFHTTRARRSGDIEGARNSEHNYRLEAVIVHPPEEEEHARRLVSRILHERIVRTGNGSFLSEMERDYEPPTQEEGFEVISEIGKPPKKPFLQM